MITIPHKEANHLNLIENSSNSPTLDLFNYYPSESCMHCLESSSCLQNYHILPNIHHIHSADDLTDFKPLFSTLENSFLDQLDDDNNEEWLEPFPLELEEEITEEDDCGCSDMMEEYAGCNCRVLNWLLEDYKQTRWRGNFDWSESPLCLLDVPSGSYHDLVALIEEYFELNAVPKDLRTDFFNDLCNFVMINKNLPRSPLSSLIVDSAKVDNNHTNDIIANISKTMAYTLICSSDKPLYLQSQENNNAIEVGVGEKISPNNAVVSVNMKRKNQKHPYSLMNYFTTFPQRNRNMKPFVSIPLQLVPSLEFIFHTLKGKKRQLLKSWKIRQNRQNLALKHQEEEQKEAVNTPVPEVLKEEEKTATEIAEKPEEKETEMAEQMVEQVRYRLVRKSEARREALNTSCLSSISSYNNTESYSNYRGNNSYSRNSPRPTFLLENFLSSITEDQKDNSIRHVERDSSDEDRHYIREIVECAKEENEKKIDDEDTAEAETIEGSQKGHESLLQQLDIFSETGTTVTVKTSCLEKTNSDNSGDYFEEKSSQASFSVASENNKMAANRKLDDIFFQENDGFIQILDKRKPKKKGGESYKTRRERDRGYDKCKSESKKQQEADKKEKAAYGKGRETVVYEAKAKEGTKAKIIVPISSAKTTTKTIINYPTITEITKTNAVVVEATPEKPKRKPLSLKSASLGFEVEKNIKVKEMVRKYFEKKCETDLNEYVGKITEESNKMMDYRMLIHTRIDYCLTKIFDGIPVQTKIFGSCATGLALPTSDVDICLCGVPAYSRNEVIQYITTIYEKLKKFKWVCSIKQILTSNVPIIKLEIDPTIEFGEVHEALDEFSILRGLIDKAPEDLDCLRDQMTRRIKIDLSIESLSSGGGAHLGYRTTEYVQKKLEEYDSLYVVAMFLKEYLTNRGFLDNYQGGISSYCLVIMIVAVFRRYKDEGGIKALKRMLQFYGEEFEPEKTGINVLGAEPFFALNYNYDEVPLWIMDNANFAGRSLGQGAFGIKRIFAEFAKTVNLIRKTQEKMETVVLRHKDKITSVEDIEKIEDLELKQLIRMSVADKMMTE